jgi:hypothetical protein
MQAHEGIQHQKARLELLDGALEARAIGWQIEPHGRGGDHLNIQILPPCTVATVARSPSWPRYGSAAHGDPLYEAMVQVGKLLRTVFLCDYFVNEAFRRELLRVLNRGEAVNALKRAIYVGRVASYQAKQHEEMQAVADALSLLANLVMAWNTMKMQSLLDRWNVRRSTAVPPGLIGRIAPTRTEGINLRGVFTFPIEQYQAQLLPSLPAAKSRAFGG